MLNLYRNIKKRRTELNMTQEELAQKMGYSGKSMIAKIEAGKVDLPQSKIMAVGIHYDCIIAQDSVFSTIIDT